VALPVSSRNGALGPVDNIASAIWILRGQKILLDAELAALYGVTTRRLNEQVRRNRKRFPDDFLFELTVEEFADLKSHLRHQVGVVVASSPGPSPSMEP